MAFFVLNDGVAAARAAINDATVLGEMAIKLKVRGVPGQIRP